MADDITISAFSRLCGISVSALRFYDQAGLLRPSAVDGTTGYRFYAQPQVAAAQRLRDLRLLEFSLEQIRRFEHASEPDQQQLIADQLTMLAARLAQAEETARSLRSRTHKEKPMAPVRIDAHALNHAIDQVLPAVSEHDELTTITNVLIESREGSLRLVATDRYRLAVRDLMSHAADAAPFRAVVDPADLRSLQPHLADTGPALISIHASAVRVACGNGQHDLAIAGTDYPPYERLLTVAREARSLAALRADVLRALERYDDEAIVHIAFGQDALDFNNGDEVVPAAYSGEQVTVALRRKFVNDAVTHSVGADIIIEATGPLAPVCFRSADDGSYLCMVMPIRIPEPATP